MKRRSNSSWIVSAAAVVAFSMPAVAHAEPCTTVAGAADDALTRRIHAELATAGETTKRLDTSDDAPLDDVIARAKELACDRLVYVTPRSVSAWENAKGESMRLLESTTTRPSDDDVGRLVARIAPARAPEPPPREPRRAEPPPSSYAWPTLLTDAAAIGLFVYARAERPTPLFRSALSGPYQQSFGWPYDGALSAAVGAWLVPTPGLDLFERRPIHAVASLLLRTAPLLAVQVAEPIGGLAGLYFRGDPHEGDCAALVRFTCGRASVEGARLGADIGFFGGVAIASFADHFLLPRPVSSKPVTAGRTNVVPQVGLDPRSPSLAVGGTF